MMLDPEISVGNLLVVASMLISAVGVIATVRVQVSALRDVVKDLAARLTRHESSLFALSGQVQRLVGHMEVEDRLVGRHE